MTINYLHKPQISSNKDVDVWYIPPILGITPENRHVRPQSCEATPNMWP